MFQVGKAAVLRSDAQTAADAAALAGADEIRRQLTVQWSTTGTTDINLVDRALVRAQMRDYAKKNGATLIESSVVIEGVDVKASVTTDDEGRERAPGRSASRTRRARRGPAPGSSCCRASAPAARSGRSRAAEGAAPGPSRRSPARTGRGSAGGSARARRAARTSSRSARFLHGSGASSSARTRRSAPVGEHDPGGYHYQLRRRSGAIDVNFGGPGDLDPQEVAAVDPIIAPLRELGFRTIWRAAGHYNHLHVDVAGSGAIGAGSGGADGGFTGPLEDVLMEVAPDRLGRAVGAVLRLRRRRRRLLHRPARPEGGTRDLLGGAQPGRLRQGAPRGLRGGDRRVRRAQPALRRPRLDRALPAARLVGQLRAADGSRHGRRGSSWSRRSGRTGRGCRAGQLAQDVQVSAFPERYDQRRVQALSLISTYCSMRRAAVVLALARGRRLRRIRGAGDVRGGGREPASRGRLRARAARPRRARPARRAAAQGRPRQRSRARWPAGRSASWASRASSA